MLLTVTLLSFQSHCMCCLDCSTVSCSVSAPCAPQQPAPPSLVQPSSQCSSSSVVPSLIPLACDSPPLSTCTETPCLNLVFVCFIYSLPVVSLVCGVSLFLPWSWIKLHPLDIPACCPPRPISSWHQRGLFIQQMQRFHFSCFVYHKKKSLHTHCSFCHTVSLSVPLTHFTSSGQH